MQLNWYLIGRCFIFTLAPVILCCSPAFAGQDSCVGKDIPVDLPQAWGFKVMAHSLTIGPSLEGALVVENLTGEALTSVEFYVGYFDVEGKLISTVPYLAQTRSAKWIGLGRRPFLEAQLARQVEPGEIFYVRGTNLLATSSLPSRGMVLSLRFTSSSRSAALGRSAYRIEPIPIELPNPLDLLWNSAFPAEILMRVRVDEEGLVEMVRQVDPPDAPPGDQNLRTTLEAYVKGWLFAPAFAAGRSIKSDMNLVVKLMKGFGIPERECLTDRSRYPESFIIATIYREQTGGKWVVDIGGYPASGLAVGATISGSQNPRSLPQIEK